MEFLIHPASLYALSILGMVVHFMKKNIAGETLTDVKNYFNDHFKSTFIAWAVTSVSVAGYVLTLATGQAADVIVVFLLGFAFDSTLNKWEKPQ